MNIDIYRKGFKIFLKFMLSYIIILFIPMLLILNMNKQAKERAITNVINNNIEKLTQTQLMIDRRLSEIDTISEQLTANSNISKISNIENPLEGKNVYAVYKTVKSLNDFSVSNKFIFEYYIYLNKGDIMLNPNHVYKYDKFMDNYIKYNIYNKEYIKNKYFKLNFSKKIIPNQTVEIKNNKIDIITYIRPLDVSINKLAYIVILIDNSAIENMLLPLIDNEDSYTYILDSNNNKISTYGIPINLPNNLKMDNDKGYYYLGEANNKQVVLYTKSQLNNWKYITIQPANSIFKYIYVMQKTSKLMIILVAIIGIIISYIFAFFETKPIVSIKNYINNNMHSYKKNKKLNDYQYIHNTMEQLYKNSCNMKSKLLSQQPLVNAGFLRRLFLGKYLSKSEIEIYSKSLQLPLSNINYCVIIINILAYYEKFSHEILNQLQQKKIIIQEVINNLIDCKTYFYDIDEKNMAMLMCLNDENKNKKYELIKGLHSRLSDKIYIDNYVKVVFYVGGISNKILDVSILYERALNINKRCYSEGVLWFNENNALSLDKFYYYPLEKEKCLVEAMKRGEEHTIRQILNDLYKKNFNIKNLSKKCLNLFLFDLFGTYVKFAEDNAFNSVEIDDIMSNWNEYTDIILHQKIIKLFFDTCKIMKDNQPEQNEELIQKISIYIQTNYYNPDLSLKLLSDKFSLSIAYLSQLFKEKTGRNFAQYLESIRMRYAKALLKESELPIKSIAQKVGYNTSNTFCRAFKRINGLSASKFRNEFRIFKE